MGRFRTSAEHLLLIAALYCAVSATLINLEVKRVMDVKSTIVISRTGIHMQNKGTKPVESFFIAIHKEDAKGLGDIWAADASAGKPLRALRLEPSTDVPGLEGDAIGFEIWFAKPLAAGAEALIDLRIDIAGMIVPVPDVIEGHEAQFMRYYGSSYFYTPYETKKMATNITLGSSSVTSKVGLEKPFELSGSKLTLGPYTDVKPLAYNEINVRFKNDRGFLVADHATKEFYVNHLGNIAVTEEFKVVNDGARHAGEWSRVDHNDRHMSKYGAVLGDVWANLPAEAENVKYKDLIGNITSSRLRRPSKGKRAIQLIFRYPLMGGWHNHFWINYEMLLPNYVKSAGSEHEMTLPLFPSLNTDLLCKELEVSVFLPEWSHAIKVVPHDSLQIVTTSTSERTTLTMFGRPVISFKLRMIRSQSKHTKTITIKYTYDPKLAWVTPGMAAFGIFLVFVGFIMCLRAGLGLVDEEDDVSLQKTKIKSQ